jgi:hypothetical protein
MIELPVIKRWAHSKWERRSNVYRRQGLASRRSVMEGRQGSGLRNGLVGPQENGGMSLAASLRIHSVINATTIHAHHALHLSTIWPFEKIWGPLAQAQASFGLRARLRRRSGNGHGIGKHFLQVYSSCFSPPTAGPFCG